MHSRLSECLKLRVQAPPKHLRGRTRNPNASDGSAWLRNAPSRRLAARFPRRVLFLHGTAANAYRHATASGSWRQAVGADARKAIPAGQRRKARRPK